MMDPIPATKDTLVLRTDFSDESAWLAVCAAIEAPIGDFQAYVSFINDPQYAGLEPKQLPALVPRNQNRSFAFVVDSTTLSDAEYPILVVDLLGEPGCTFRVIPSEAWSVENNLSIANMAFDEFAAAIDQDGVFRGFPTT